MNRKDEKKEERLLDRTSAEPSANDEQNRRSFVSIFALFFLLTDRSNDVQIKKLKKKREREKLRLIITDRNGASIVHCTAEMSNSIRPATKQQ